MKTLIVVLGVLSVAFGFLAGWRVSRRRDVSQAWMVDNQRRKWGEGIDQSCSRWPWKRKEGA